MNDESKFAASCVLRSAVQHLHSGRVPESLPCRLREEMQLKRFIASLLQRQTGGAVYVAGSPGTGKTASIVGTALEMRTTGAPLSKFWKLGM
jgi:origin recognition complex subunit 1